MAQVTGTLPPGHKDGKTCPLQLLTTLHIGGRSGLTLLGLPV
jgi:hypothetical protein